MTATHDVTDDQLREVFARRASSALPSDLQATIVDATAPLAQRRRSPAGLRVVAGRSGPGRLLAVAAAIAVVGAAGWLAVGGRGEQPSPLPATALETLVVPSPSTSAATASDPSIVETAIGGLKVQYRLPEGSDLRPAPVAGTMIALTPGGRALYQTDDSGKLLPGQHGIVIALTRDAVTHPCPLVDGESSRVPVREAPSAFVEDLRSIAGVDLGAPVPISLDGHSALMFPDEFRSSTCDLADIHVSGGGGISPSWICLTVPSQIDLVEIDGRTWLIQAWASTGTEFPAWAPTATTLINTIRFR